MDPVTKWFLMDAATVSAAEYDCRSRHEANSDGELSITWNITGTQALVKVCGADDGWLSGMSWAGDVTATYTEETHDDIFAWFYTPEWQSSSDPAWWGA